MKPKKMKAWAVYYRSTHSMPVSLYTNDGRWEWRGSVGIFTRKSEALEKSREINKIGNITMVLPVLIKPLI